MYLLSGGLVSLFFVLSLLWPLEEAEAGMLMGKGLGIGELQLITSFISFNDLKMQLKAWAAGGLGTGQDTM